MNVTVILLAKNAEKHIAKAIESVLNQSLSDFECLVVNEGSTDQTMSIVESIKDPRVRIIDNIIGATDSLSKAVHQSSGDYITHMRTMDIMHIDRLKIQTCIMNDEPTIAVCGSLLYYFRDKLMPQLGKTIVGLVENPLVQFLGDSLLLSNTFLYRRSFLQTHNIDFSGCSEVAEFKRVVDVAKNGGIFYFESQPLMYQRLVDLKDVGPGSGVTIKEKITAQKNEIIDFLICNSSSNQEPLNALKTSLLELQKLGITNSDFAPMVFRLLFTQNKTFTKDF